MCVSVIFKWWKRKREAQTTLGGTCLDLVIHITETLDYISYFSYHRPILNRLYTADVKFNEVNNKQINFKKPNTVSLPLLIIRFHVKY